MKKILGSFATIAFMGTMAFSGFTGAFFSDTESSTGNTFVGGEFDLQIDSTQHYAGLVCTEGVWVIENEEEGTTRPDLVGDECGGTWAMKDLQPGIDKFFDFSDLKPGDQGENTISAHTANDRYSCLDFSNVIQNDNTLTEPEEELLDTLDVGELGQHIEFVLWRDNGAGDHEGNNIWDAEEFGSVVPVQMPLDTFTLTLVDSSTGPPTPGDAVRYTGMAWCLGDFTAFGPGIERVCDGSSVSNIAQTDSYSVDLTFRSVQSRNNPNFLCNPVP